jgi:hypothetical protein
MSWFNIPYSKKVIDREEKIIVKKYGKTIKRINEIKEIDSLPVIDDMVDHEDVKSLDENKDEKFDYSDLED